MPRRVGRPLRKFELRNENFSSQICEDEECEREAAYGLISKFRFQKLAKLFGARRVELNSFGNQNALYRYRTIYEQILSLQFFIN